MPETSMGGDDGWVVTVPVRCDAGVGVPAPGEVALTEVRLAQLRELGVERVLVAGVGVIECSVFLAGEAANASEVGRAVGLAGEAVRLVAGWCAWDASLEAAGPVRATWCEGASG